MAECKEAKAAAEFLVLATLLSRWLPTADGVMKMKRFRWRSVDNLTGVRFHSVNPQLCRGIRRCYPLSLGCRFDLNTSRETSGSPRACCPSDHKAASY